MTVKTLKDSFQAIIFAGRWTIAPMYAGLLIALIIYSYKFCTLLAALVTQMFTISEEHLMLSVLSLVDISMVGNLIIMIMIGGYSIFLRRINLHGRENRPQWLDHINSGTLKVKMGTSLIGVSSIHLLKDFVGETGINYKHIIIHLIFVASTLALAFTDKLLHENHSENNHPAVIQ